MDLPGIVASVPVALLEGESPKAVPLRLRLGGVFAVDDRRLRWENDELRDDEDVVV